MSISWVHHAASYPVHSLSRRYPHAEWYYPNEVLRRSTEEDWIVITRARLQDRRRPALADVDLLRRRAFPIPARVEKCIVDGGKTAAGGDASRFIDEWSDNSITMTTVCVCVCVCVCVGVGVRVCVLNVAAESARRRRGVVRWRGGDSFPFPDGDDMRTEPALNLRFVTSAKDAVCLFSLSASNFT